MLKCRAMYSNDQLQLQKSEYIHDIIYQTDASMYCRKVHMHCGTARPSNESKLTCMLTLLVHRKGIIADYPRGKGGSSEVKKGPCQ